LFFFFLYFFYIFFIDDFEGLLFGVVFVPFEELIAFGLFVELEDEGDFGLELLEEGGESSGTGVGEDFVLFVGVAVGLFDRVDFVKALFLYLLELDMMKTFPEFLLEGLQLSSKLINKLLVVIEHLGLLNLVLLCEGSELLDELIVVLGDRAQEFVQVLE
jgi:hypothetical protein